MSFGKIQCSITFLIIAFLFNACVLLRPSPQKLYSRAIKNGPYDVVIVPGFPYNGDDWSPAFKFRVIWACYLVKKGIAKNVIFSGGAIYTPYIEAKSMALYAEELGISKDKIILETQAQHSTENIYNSYWIAKKRGFTKIALATDRYQSSLLMGFTKRRFHLPIIHIPFLIDTLSIIDNVHPQIVADSAKVKNFKSIIETQSSWHRMRGTLGKNIKFEKE